jgi:hypothetical protein
VNRSVLSKKRLHLTIIVFSKKLLCLISYLCLDMFIKRYLHKLKCLDISSHKQL